MLMAPTLIVFTVKVGVLVFVKKVIEIFIIYMYYCMQQHSRHAMRKCLMKEEIYAIPLWDAFRKDTECRPLCAIQMDVVWVLVLLQ